MYNDQGHNISLLKFINVLSLAFPSLLTVRLEAQQKNAWVSDKPAVVISQAQSRLRLQGWDAVRPALSTTVRAWIMRGFMEGGMRRNKSAQVEFLGFALEVLDWGSRAWKDVPKDDRGAIFERTFIRGVRSLHINALMEVRPSVLLADDHHERALLNNWIQAYAQDPGPNSRYPIENLLEEADVILREMDEHDPRPTHGGSYDAGFISSFYIYPAAQATSLVIILSLVNSFEVGSFLSSMKAYYYAEMAPRCYPDTDAARDHLRKSGNLYIEAANMYPEDDEKHACKSTSPLRAKPIKLKFSLLHFTCSQISLTAAYIIYSAAAHLCVRRCPYLSASGLPFRR